LRIDTRLRKMRRWCVWSRCSGNDVGVVWKRAGSPVKCGHTKGLLLIEIGLYRLLTSCGAGVDALQRRTSKVEEVRQREVRDLGWHKYQTIVVVEFYRVRCPRCGLKSGDRSAVA
jgi:hypothetical protein